MSGPARRRDVAPRPGAHDQTRDGTGVDGASVLEWTAEQVGAALRQQPVDDTAEQAAVTAFRDALTAGERALRTRRRDDWRPKTPRQRWVRAGAVAIVTSALLGGIAFASIRVADTQQHDTPDPIPSASTHQPPAYPGQQRSSTAGPTTPTTPANHPDTARNVQAHCRAYERVKNRGHALGAAAWQRLIHAAGGEQQVAAYCAQMIGPADKINASPPKANKTGKGQGKPSTKSKPSKGPSNRSR
ncbi:hypothetical protein [Streptomyces sp. NPDC046862]|uniref:hypothetical protein n=1 Tax=Streptomyces sp. NPDC046862 TaxID=3154603 RepID=UPI0034552130